jgi:hypothetical protein
LYAVPLCGVFHSYIAMTQTLEMRLRGMSFESLHTI